MEQTVISTEGYLSEATRMAWNVIGLNENVASRKIEKVGIIGAGTMGGGIAMNFATAGLSVTIVETKQEALDRGLATVRKNYQRSADRGRFPQEEVDSRMSRIEGSLSLTELSDCDLVIEAVFEDMDVKTTIFKQLDQIVKPGAILATNTSALDIDQIARATRTPQNVVGLHFFSPANVMKLLEVVRAEKTSDEVVATSMAIAKEIGKIAVLVGVCDGFVGNRILFARHRQNMALIKAGVMPWDIDKAFLEFGFRMGPFQMNDLAGLDIGWKKGEASGDPIRDALCELNRKGQKTGAGFYDYDDQRKPIPSDVTAKIIADVSGVPAGSVSMSGEEIIARCIYPMINEAVLILEENKAQRASDIDVVWVYGYGWPADKGGVLYYADTIGAPAILETLKRMNREGADVNIAASLERLAKDEQRFTELEFGGLRTDDSKK